jgi:exopolysaccharide biosynthesis protein
MSKREDILLIEVKGLDKEEILISMGYEISKDGLLLRDGMRVKTRDNSGYAKAKDVKAILPGSLEVITDLSEAESYFSEN